MKQKSAGILYWASRDKSNRRDDEDLFQHTKQLAISCERKKDNLPAQKSCDGNTDDLEKKL